MKVYTSLLLTLLNLAALPPPSWAQVKVREGFFKKLREKY